MVFRVLQTIISVKLGEALKHERIVDYILYCHSEEADTNISSNLYSV